MDELPATTSQHSRSVLHAIWQVRGLVVVSSLLWSTSGFFVKSPFFSGWPGPTLAFWRAAFACVILWPFVRKPRWSWTLIPMTAMFAAMNYTYLTAMAEGSAANAIWLQCTGQVWVLLIGVFLFKERAVARDWMFVLFSAAGVAVIVYFEAQQIADDPNKNPLTAIYWGVLTGVLYGGIVLCMRHLRDFDPVWLAAMNHLVTALALAPGAMTSGYFPSGVQWLLLAAFGMFQMGLPYVLFAHALKRIPGHEALGIGMIEPILVPVWVFLAWSVPPAWWTLVGGGLILVGLTLRYVGASSSTVDDAAEAHA
jgi:drug/metabolite transporter (DMT)-like permease